jgi:hypothetical protein
MEHVDANISSSLNDVTGMRRHIFSSVYHSLKSFAVIAVYLFNNPLQSISFLFLLRRRDWLDDIVQLNFEIDCNYIYEREDGRRSSGLTNLNDQPTKMSTI